MDLTRPFSSMDTALDFYDLDVIERLRVRVPQGPIIRML